jgi:hypothetical protein
MFWKRAGGTEGASASTPRRRLRLRSDELLNAHWAAKRLKGDATYKSLREQMLKQQWGTYQSNCTA